MAFGLQAPPKQVACRWLCTPSVHDPYTIRTPCSCACHARVGGSGLALGGLLGAFVDTGQSFLLRQANPASIRNCVPSIHPSPRQSFLFAGASV
jgi:hypothetical protein